jgi:NTP pyrophosphatase (non-canonical NTP hydrolase)
MLPSDPHPLLTLAGFQGWIHERYYATDNARGTAATFLWFIEEVGELATALQDMAQAPDDPDVHANLAAEFADVLAWLCTLANINEVDLTEAVRRKYLDSAGPEGTKH